VLALAFPTPWLTCAGFLWSEPVFILLFSGYVYSLYRCGTKGQVPMLLLATVCGLLRPLQRVSGFFVLAGAATLFGAGMAAAVGGVGAWFSGSIDWEFLAVLLLSGCSVAQAARKY